MKLLDGIVVAAVLVILWAVAIGSYKHFVNQPDDEPEIAVASSEAQDGQAPLSESQDSQPDDRLMLGKYEMDYWKSLTKEQQQAILDQENQARWDEADERMRRAEEAQWERARERREETQRVAEERAQQREAEDQERQTARIDELRRESFSESGEMMRGSGVNTRLLNKYRQLATTPRQQQGYAEFEACTTRFDSAARDYSRNQSTLTTRQEATLTKRVVPHGRETRNGLDTGSHAIVRTGKFMTCAEFLRASKNYDQKAHCQLAQSRVEELENEMRGIQLECTRLASKAGLMPGNVRAILQLPR